MTVIKQYNAGTAAWETIVVGKQGPTGATGPQANRNLLINGDFRVAQRGTSFTSTTTPANSDDTFLLDRWNLLSDGNDAVDVTQATDVPTGGLNSIGLDVETANKKFGIVQFVEQKNIVGVQDQTVALSFKAKVTGSSISNVKAVVLSWTGTADTVTSDVVSAWNASGTTPTWATNWTAENTPANLNVTTSWASYNVTAPVDTASVKNLAVFIWCDDATTTVGDFLYLTDVQLEIASAATAFERRPIDIELSACQRYYQEIAWRWQGVSGTSGYRFTVPLLCTMRRTPDVTAGTTSTGNGFTFNSFEDITSQKFVVLIDGTTGNNAYIILTGVKVNAEL